LRVSVRCKSTHLYPIRIDARKCGIDRDAFASRMTEARIGIGIHYLSLAEHPFYQERFGWASNEWPEAAAYGAQTVSLPFSPKLRPAELERIATAVRGIVAR
jgi:dTDP-4-amino-4,6-dideoxygalactose transaminase